MSNSQRRSSTLSASDSVIIKFVGLSLTLIRFTLRYHVSRLRRQKLKSRKVLMILNRNLQHWHTCHLAALLRSVPAAMSCSPERTTFNSPARARRDTRQTTHKALKGRNNTISFMSPRSRLAISFPPFPERSRRAIECRTLRCCEPKLCQGKCSNLLCFGLVVHAHGFSPSSCTDTVLEAGGCQAMLRRTFRKSGASSRLWLKPVTYGLTSW